MTGIAIVFMLIAMLTIWGGLGIAILNLSTRGNSVEESSAPGEVDRET